MARGKKRSDWAGTAGKILDGGGTGKKGGFAIAQDKIAAGVEHQPLNQVEWVPRESLHSNLYNPNKVATPEMQLLRASILEDGWTQPIVVRDNGDGGLEIVDGFHRWTISGDTEVMALTDGLVPVVRLRAVSIDHQMMSTIRHNRARGNHMVLHMAEIVRTLIDKEGQTKEQVMARLGMEWEEVDRLYDRGGILVAAGKEEFSKGWIPD